MPERHTHRIGDHLMVCDESGIVDYASNMRKRWDGAWVRPKGWETRQPQEFVRARKDPAALKDIRARDTDAQAFTAQPVFVGLSTVRTKSGPGTHLFDPGIGAMEIGQSFLVR